MPLLREIEKLDDVPEYARAGYKQVEGGKYVNEDIEDVAALRNTAKARRDERERIERELAPYKELGLSPKEIADLKAEAARHHDAGDSEKDVEKLIAKRVAEARKEFEPVQQERDALAAENRKLALTDAIRAAFIAAGGIEEDADDVVRLYEDQFDLGDKHPKTGRRKVIVKDEDGDATDRTPQEWFEKDLKKRKPKYFKGTGAAGGGAHQSGAAGGAGTREELAKLPPAERLARARELGIK